MKPKTELDEYDREYAEKYRHIEPSGPLWTLKRRYVWMYDYAVRLEKLLAEKMAYINELTGIIEEMDREREDP